MDMDINSNGNNAAIKYNILSNKQMKKAGFKRHNDKWMFIKKLGDDITLNISIPNDNGDIDIRTYDEQYMQDYDYQYVLKVYPNEFSFRIRDKVSDVLEMLIDKDIIYGWKRGDYI